MDGLASEGEDGRKELGQLELDVSVGGILLQVEQRSRSVVRCGPLGTPRRRCFAFGAQRYKLERREESKEGEEGKQTRLSSFLPSTRRSGTHPRLETSSYDDYSPLYNSSGMKIVLTLWFFSIRSWNDLLVLLLLLPHRCRSRSSSSPRRRRRFLLFSSLLTIVAAV